MHGQPRPGVGKLDGLGASRHCIETIEMLQMIEGRRGMEAKLSSQFWETEGPGPKGKQFRLRRAQLPLSISISHATRMPVGWSSNLGTGVS